MRTLKSLLLLLVAVIALSSCTGEQARDDKPSAPAPTAADLLGFASPYDTYRIQLADAAERQLVVQECMAAQGFEYAPIMPPVPSFYSSNLSGLEFAELYGYGILTSFEDVEVAAYVNSNPNDSALALMANSEWWAWMEAFTGLTEGVVESGEIETADGSLIGDGGCIDLVVRDDSRESIRDQLTFTYEDKLIELEQSVQSDPEYSELIQQWAICMKSAGFSASGEGSARHTFRMLYAELADTVVLDESGSVSFDSEGLDAGIRDEIETAVQDWKCEDPIRARREAIRAERSQEFWQTNPRMLAELSSARLNG